MTWNQHDIIQANIARTQRRWELIKKLQKAAKHGDTLGEEQATYDLLTMDAQDDAIARDLASAYGFIRHAARQIMEETP